MALASARARSVFDVFQGHHKPIGNARDAFWTAHLKVASYEILERVVERAGDGETARVGRENRAQGWVIAGRIAEAWDRFVDLVLSDRGRRT